MPHEAVPACCGALPALLRHDWRGVATATATTTSGAAAAPTPARRHGADVKRRKVWRGVCATGVPTDVKRRTVSTAAAGATLSRGELGGDTGACGRPPRRP